MDRLLKAWFWLYHAGMMHTRSDLGPVFHTERLPRGTGVGKRRCLKCGRVFVDLDPFDWSSSPVK